MFAAQTTQQMWTLKGVTTCGQLLYCVPEIFLNEYESNKKFKLKKANVGISLEIKVCSGLNEEEEIFLQYQAAPR